MELIWMQEKTGGRRDGKKDAEMLQKALDDGIMPELKKEMEKIEADPLSAHMERDRKKVDRLSPYIMHIRPGAAIVEWMGTYMIAVTRQQKQDVISRLEKEHRRRVRADAGLIRALEEERAAAGG